MLVEASFSLLADRRGHRSGVELVEASASSSHAEASASETNENYIHHNYTPCWLKPSCR